MIQFILNWFENAFGMGIIECMAFIYVFRNFLSFVLWCIKQFKKSIGV